MINIDINKYLEWYKKESYYYYKANAESNPNYYIYLINILNVRAFKFDNMNLNNDITKRLIKTLENKVRNIKKNTPAIPNNIKLYKHPTLLEWDNLSKARQLNPTIKKHKQVINVQANKTVNADYLIKQQNKFKDLPPQYEKILNAINDFTPIETPFFNYQYFKEIILLIDEYNFLKTTIQQLKNHPETTPLKNSNTAPLLTKTEFTEIVKALYLYIQSNPKQPKAPENLRLKIPSEKRFIEIMANALNVKIDKNIYDDIYQNIKTRKKINVKTKMLNHLKILFSEKTFNA